MTTNNPSITLASAAASRIGAVATGLRHAAQADALDEEVRRIEQLGSSKPSPSGRQSKKSPKKGKAS